MAENMKKAAASGLSQGTYSVSFHLFFTFVVAIVNIDFLNYTYNKNTFLLVLRKRNIMCIVFKLNLGNFFIKCNN